MAGCRAWFETPRLSEHKTLAETLKPLPTAIDAVQLDIVFGERLVDEHELEQELWKDIDQIAGMSIEQRMRVEEAGFRVGVVGSNPPLELQRLLGLNTGKVDALTLEQKHLIAGRTIVLRPGGETEILASPPRLEVSSTDFPELQEDGEPPETFENMRCVLHMRMERLQDGWVRLHFTPAIHHGQSQLRRVAGPTGWELKSSQKVKTFPEYRFSVKLSLGEMVLIACDQALPDGFGQRFFRSMSPEGEKKRLITVRLSHMQKLNPIYHEQ